jgi:hypothetical protein
MAASKYLPKLCFGKTSHDQLLLQAHLVVELSARCEIARPSFSMVWCLMAGAEVSWLKPRRLGSSKGTYEYSSLDWFT